MQTMGLCEQGISVKILAAGAEHTAAVTESGKLYGWGWGRYGNLGLGDRNDRLVPGEVAPVPVCSLFYIFYTSLFIPILGTANYCNSDRKVPFCTSLMNLHCCHKIYLCIFFRCKVIPSTCEFLGCKMWLLLSLL